jgi:THO complex subunit 7
MASNPVLNEDDLIKKRLLVEGDSGNEDRLINKLIRNFIKWSSYSAVDHNQASSQQQQQQQSAQGANEIETENVESLYDQMVASLSHAEFGLLRNQFILDMNKMEQDNYDELYKRIDGEIEKAKRKIVESKLELQEARKIRKNRQEYDMLARQIQNYPDRAEMQATIKSLEEKLESLKKVDNEYVKKLEQRRKQFSVVLQALSSMKNLIENDSKLEDILLNQAPDEANDDAAATAANTSQKPIQLQSNQTNGGDSEAQASAHSKREKHTVAEVEMEEV